MDETSDRLNAHDEEVAAHAGAPLADRAGTAGYVPLFRSPTLSILRRLAVSSPVR